MNKKQQLKSNQYHVSVVVQRLFVFMIIPAFGLVLAYSVWSLISQMGSGNDNGPYFAYLFEQQMTPALLFILAFVLNPRQLSLLSKSFESLLVATSAYIGWGLLSGLLLTTFFAIIDKSNIMGSELYIYVTYMAFLVLFVATLLYLRVRGKWS
jgi:hypothetical protein